LKRHASDRLLIWALRNAEYTKRNGAILAKVVRGTLPQFVDTIDYGVKKIGVDHVGIASDFNHGGGVIGCDNEGGAVKRDGGTVAPGLFVFNRKCQRMHLAEDAPTLTYGLGRQLSADAAFKNPVPRVARTTKEIGIT
jgi:microsomal dipeptidase-like Zn-dependent dipeptidase